jgi:ABC-type uncharacterized transport system involved in gliding motility auxiliary subunit
MTTDPKHSTPSPSFSTARRWKIGLDAVVRTFLVLAVVVMANYISSIFPRQFFLSSQTRVQLSPRTINLLQTLTNHVEVTVYYDKSDGMYSTIMALLNEYHRLDPRITVNMADYVRDPATAAQVAEKYHLASSEASKNLIIFDCNGFPKIAHGEALVQYGPTGMKDKKIEFRPIAFNGEKMFTSMLLAITSPNPLKAYFLQGDGEPSLSDSSGNGYMKFAEILEENYVQIEPLSLLGNDNVPSDCNLLIIAGPIRRFSDSELTKIDHYLSQGGRLMALLNVYSINQPTGLEGVLAHWGVNVGDDYIIDHEDANSDGQLIYIQNFSDHPSVNSLTGSSLVMVLPRPVFRINTPDMPADSLKVTPLAASSANSVLAGLRGIAPQAYPLMAAVEQNPVKGIANANGNMRMIVAGDSLFLNNQIIGEVSANGDFASLAANWLLDPQTLLNGIGPRPVDSFRLFITQKQMRNVRWLLLGALPSMVLAFGGLVWLRRRK